MSIDRAFQEFHATHPEVYVELVRLARLAKTLGRKRLGIKRLWEVMRWELDLRSRADEGYKLNNNHHSRYARLIMDQEPDLRGMFETRKLSSEPEAPHVEPNGVEDDYYEAMQNLFM